MTGEERLALRFMNDFPAEAARILEVLPLDDAAELLRIAPPATAGPVLGTMEPAVLVGLLERLPGQLTATIDNMSPLAVTSLLRAMTPSGRREVLAGIDPERANRLESQLRFNLDQIGSLMNPRYNGFSRERLVKDALKHIRRHPAAPGHHVYVTGAAGLLLGYLPWPTLLAARPGVRLGTVLKKDIGRLVAADPISLLRNHGDWRRFPELPVTSENGELIGVVDYRTFRSLESGRSPAASASESAAGALGELYGIGLSAFLRGTTALVDKEGRQTT